MQIMQSECVHLEGQVGTCAFLKSEIAVQFKCHAGSQMMLLTLLNSKGDLSCNETIDCLWCGNCCQLSCFWLENSDRRSTKVSEKRFVFDLYQLCYRHYRRWCIFFKLVYALAQRKPICAQFWPICHEITQFLVYFLHAYIQGKYWFPPVYIYIVGGAIPFQPQHAETNF